jgi:hypothetical protein
MRAFLSSGLALGLVALPAWVVAQSPPSAPAPAPTSPVVPAIPVSATPPAAPTAPADITVNIGGQAKRGIGPIAPLPKVDFALPPGMEPTAQTSAPAAPIPLPLPQPPAPPAKLTPAQIARQIAPNFDTARDYVRLTQCYGVADFMGAVTRIQASRPGATPQIVNVARSIATLQDAMQPMVLAASTVRSEARFRADYDAIARRGQQELATSRTPNVTMQRRLASLDACRADVVRWRGGR